MPAACSMTALRDGRGRAGLPLPRVEAFDGNGGVTRGPAQFAAPALRGDNRGRRQHHRRWGSVGLGKHPNVSRLNRLDQSRLGLAHAPPTMPAFVSVGVLPLSAPPKQKPEIGRAVGADVRGLQELPYPERRHVQHRVASSCREWSPRNGGSRPTDAALARGQKEASVPVATAPPESERRREDRSAHQAAVRADAAPGRD